jgi:hypothetical protein
MELIMPDHPTPNITCNSGPTQSVAKLLKPNEAADILGVSPACLEKWRVRRNAALRWVRVGRCIRYRNGDLEEFIAKSTVEEG